MEETPTPCNNNTGGAKRKWREASSLKQTAQDELHRWMWLDWLIADRESITQDGQRTRRKPRTGRKCSRGGRGPPEVTTKGKINWFAIVLHLNANSFVVFVMCTFKFCHSGWCRVYWPGKGRKRIQWNRWRQMKKQPPRESYTTAFIHVPGRLLDLNVRSSHLNLIKWIIKRTKSFLTHMNRIAKLPTFGNSISIFYQTQLNSNIIGGKKQRLE